MIETALVPVSHRRSGSAVGARNSGVGQLGRLVIHAPAFFVLPARRRIAGSGGPWFGAGDGSTASSAVSSRPSATTCIGWGLGTKSRQCARIDSSGDRASPRRPQQAAGRSVHLVGWSLGGYLSREAARRATRSCGRCHHLWITGCRRPQVHGHGCVLPPSRIRSRRRRSHRRGRERTFRSACRHRNLSHARIWSLTGGRVSTESSPDRGACGGLHDAPRARLSAPRSIASSLSLWRTDRRSDRVPAILPGNRSVPFWPPIS